MSLLQDLAFLALLWQFKADCEKNSSVRRHCQKSYHTQFQD
jgi:hypothetical protein